MCEVRTQDARLVEEKVGGEADSNTLGRCTGKRVKSLKREHVGAQGIELGGEASDVALGLVMRMGLHIGPYLRTAL